MVHEYPMWFRDTVSQLVVKFDSLTSGVVVEVGGTRKVGYRGYNWVDHTDTNSWENVTDQYKGKQMENNTIEINTAHTPIEELQQIVLNGKTYNLVPVEETKPEEPTIKKWEPEGGLWTVGVGGVRKAYSTKECANHGIEYATKEQAQKAYKEIRKHNRLLAWLAENHDGWEADWTNSDSKYYVAYAHDRGKYEVYDNYTTESLTLVFMSEDNATKLADLLNKGIVEL